MNLFKKVVVVVVIVVVVVVIVVMAVGDHHFLKILSENPAITLLTPMTLNTQFTPFIQIIPYTLFAPLPNSPNYPDSTYYPIYPKSVEQQVTAELVTSKLMTPGLVTIEALSRVPNVGNFNPARLIGKVCRTSLVLCKKARGFQKFMLSLQETTASWSNFHFLLKKLIQSCF